jgi:hypothetical protein
VRLFSIIADKNPRFAKVQILWKKQLSSFRILKPNDRKYIPSIRISGLLILIHYNKMTQTLHFVIMVSVKIIIRANISVFFPIIGKYFLQIVAKLELW